MNEQRPPKKDDGGGGGWITTFADLMSLLMCFFVLLLSFAELDIMKFKAIAGSMKLAFGVQREIKAIEVPKGTSIIAQEFSAAKPDPSVINEVRQQTTDEDKQSLEFTDALVDDADGTNPEGNPGGKTAEERRAEEQLLEDAARLAAALKNEIDAGMIEIETEGQAIIIRIREKGSFPSGAAKFDPAFGPVAVKLRESLNEIGGRIVVAGHTDDVPIRTALYRSNWDLSSARAVSVVHALLEDSSLEPGRFVVEGHGEAHPLVDNDTRENRALNRRVEITIRQNLSPADAAPPAAAPETQAASAASVEEPRHQATATTAIPAIPAIPGVPEVPAVPSLRSPSPTTPQRGLAAPSTPVAAPASPAGEDPAATSSAALTPPPRNQLPVPAAVPLTPASPFSEPAAAAVFPERRADAPKSRLDVIRDGVRGRP